MPTDLVRRIDLDKLEPDFLGNMLEVVARCQARGWLYVATLGYRTLAEQAALYARFKQGGPRAAPPGSSAHQYGLAVDFARYRVDGAKGKFTWDAHDFDVLGEEAEAQGLDWGGRYGDADHIGAAGYVNAAQLAPLYKAYNSCYPDEDAGLLAAWAVIKTQGAARP